VHPSHVYKPTKPIYCRADSRHASQSIEILDGDKLISKKSFNNVRTIRNPVPTFQPLRSWRAAQLHRNSRSEKSSHSLSFKLHLNFQRYQGKYERLKLQTDEYLMQSDSAKDEIKMLNRLKDLLNDLTKKNSICEKFYANFDLVAARQILINPTPHYKNITLLH
jgi:hypothetical protein